MKDRELYPQSNLFLRCLPGDLLVVEHTKHRPVKGTHWATEEYVEKKLFLLFSGFEYHSKGTFANRFNSEAPQRSICEHVSAIAKWIGHDDGPSLYEFLLDDNSFKYSIVRKGEQI